MCDCSYNNRTTCHVTRLRVVALNVQGVIPPELAQLPFLEFLKLDQNYLTGPLPAFLGNLSSLWILSFGSNNFSGQLPAELGSLPNLEQL
ncbi:hypothetical protein ACHQM5_025434 [Ranunculus cassubicifolius]